MFHRPRGASGLWQPVFEGEGLRVTKGKGKKIKLSVHHVDKRIKLDRYVYIEKM